MAIDDPTAAAALRARWALDPAVAFLNHGSFGACPTAVLEAQTALRRRFERQPVQFFARDLERLLDEARGGLAPFLGADPDDLAFVANATAGVNAVLRSLRFAPGDELLTTDHAYGACRNTLAWVAERTGARVVVAQVPFPIADPAAVLEAVLAAVGPRTRLAMVDHVTSPTGLVFPLAELIAGLAARGVDTLVDGAHAPGMVPVDLRALGAAYYTGNCHKWLCAPKGAGFLHVRRDRQRDVHPTSISHGLTAARTDRPRFRLEFDWTGTTDPTPWLCVPEAIRYVGSLVAGGWDAIRRRNHALAVAARARVAAALGVAPPCPDAMIGSLAALPFPDGSAELPASALYADPTQDALLGRFGVEVPIYPWPAPPRRLIRLSAHLYNAPADYDRLAAALPAVLAAG